MEHARRAVELLPDHPPNQLCLGEALEAVEEPAAGRRAYERAAELARARLEAGHAEAALWLAEAEGQLGP